MEVESLVPTPHLKTLCETRLDLDVIDPAPSLVHIQLPSTGAFARQTRPVITAYNATSASKDEADFQKRNAATAASVFFRVGLEEDEEKYPRAVSWRVVESSSTLELRALDLTRSEAQPDRTEQILRYAFPSDIRSGGVALADLQSDHAVCAFVMTKNNELYTIILRSSLFSRPPPTSEEVEQTFQSFRPSALSISTFYKVFAPSSRVLLLSLGDGRLSQLSRKDGEDGSNWAERTYDDGQWAASFRGLLSWHPRPTIQHEGNSLNLKTIHMAMVSPNQEHILTTGLDHTLKAWSVSTGKPTIIRDLLNQPLPEDGSPKHTLDPSTTTSLRLFESRSGGGYTYYAVTFSTQKSGLFKFWAIVDPENPDEGVRDCFEDKELRLPDPGDGALWTLSDFDVRSSAATPEIDVWMLMRLNKRFKLFHRRFHDVNSLGEGWDTEWVATVVDTPQHESIISADRSTTDQLDLSNQWLKHIFRPGRVPNKVIETALSVYMHSKSERIKIHKGPLRDRVAAAVTSQIPRVGNMSHQTGSKVLDTATREWSNFWNIVRDVNGLRWEPLSLAVDDAERTAWVAFTDGFSVVRDCSDLELLAHNDAEVLEDLSASRALPSIEESDRGTSNLREQASVVSTAAVFRSSFSSALRQACERVFTEELWTDPSMAPSDRMQNLYDRCNFAEDISSRQFEELRSSLEDVGGFVGLRSHHFLAILEQVPTSRKEPKSDFTHIGLGALVCGAQTMISLRFRVLQDLLYLLVFIFGEVDPAEDLTEALELEQTFLALVEQTKRAQLGQWLATSSRTSSTTADGRLPREVLPPEATVLRDLFAADIKPHNEDAHDGRSGLTQAIQRLLTWAAGDYEISLEDAVVSIQCDLLQKRNLELALSFQSFLPSSAWSTYVKGRLHLLREEFSEAEICFKHAAFRLSRPDPPSSRFELSSSGLLDADAASLFASGLSKFYSHIVGLFEGSFAYVQAQKFARLALQHLHDTSPDHEQTSSLLNRLFCAALALGDFDSAASALTRIPSKVIQHAALRELIARIVDTGAVNELLHLPLPHLQKDVDALLAERARAEGERGAIGQVRIPYFRILYAWRLRLGDTRGAAAVLVERLEATKRRQGKQVAKSGVAASTAAKGYEQALDEYLVGINALALVGDSKGTGTEGGEEGWVFIETEGEPRRVVRLQDLRNAYGEEMDRVGMLEMGRFGIVDYDERDDADDEGAMDLRD